MGKFTRRDFLRISSYSATAMGASGMTGTLGTLTASAQALIGSTKTVKSYCEMCSSRCQIEGRVVNGKLDLIIGNSLSSGMGTSICARGGAGHSQLYDPQRLVKPLIRTGGKRGDNSYREATYEEAFDLIAKKMGEIKEKYGAKSVLFSAKTGEHYHHMATFAKAYGSPNLFDHESSCPITYKIAQAHTYGASLKADFGGAKYILNFGHNLLEGINISATKKLSEIAAKPNAKLVVLEPRFSILSAKADEWYAVKPGTDLAFLLALIHVWLRDGKYDKEFVEKHTIGIEKLIESTKETTPQWQEGITGIKASVAEKVANELFQAAPHCIIDWGHKTTTGPSEYQRTRAILTANVLMGNFERNGGVYFGKNANAVNVAACMDVAPGLAKMDADIKASKEIRIDHSGEPGDNIFVSRGTGVLMDIPKAVLTKTPYEVKGWLMIRTNPLITVANPKEMRKAMDTMDFIVCIDVYRSESALMADVILPEATYLERDEGIEDVSSKAPAYHIRNKMVEPINNTLSSNQIFRTLAKKLNVDSGYTWDNINTFRMQQVKGNDKLLTDLITKGYVAVSVPPLMYREKAVVAKFVEKFPSAGVNVDSNGMMTKLFEKFNTPSGKIEIFSQEVENAFPGYGVTAKDDMDIAKKYPYILTSGKTAIHTNGHTQNVPYLNMLMKDNPVWVNPKTAEKEGLKNGQTVYLENEVGKEKVTILITEGIREDTLFVYMGFGRESPELKRTNGVGFNQSKLLPLIKGPVCSTMITNVGVKISKA